MEKRTNRVSEAQWSILIDFLECHPSLARARGYNNTPRGRAESSRLWEEVATLVNADGSGTTKTPKDWSVYVSNYKSKLKKIVADQNADANGTGGGPPRRSSYLSDQEKRFLAIMGPGFGQTAPRVSVEPFSNESQQQTSTLGRPELSQDNISHDEQLEEVIISPLVQNELLPSMNEGSSSSINVAEQPIVHTPASQGPTNAFTPPLPRQTRTRQMRYRGRPLAPLDEARRILAQVEMQRAAADAAKAEALNLIGQNLGRLADAVERLLAQKTP